MPSFEILEAKYRELHNNEPVFLKDLHRDHGSWQEDELKLEA